MNVRIDSGPVEEWQCPLDVPKEKWPDLLRTKRYFLKTNIQHDCRSLLQFVEHANHMWEALGFKSVTDMIKTGYELKPREVNLALEWLKIKDPEEAVSFENAVKSARQQRAERNKKIKELREQGFTQRQIADEVGIDRSRVAQVVLEKSEISQKTNTETQQEQANKNDISRRTQVKIDKIKKIDPELAEKAERKEIKVAEAERIIGIASSKLDKIKAQCKGLNTEEMQDLVIFLQEKINQQGEKE